VYASLPALGLLTDSNLPSRSLETVIMFSGKNQVMPPFNEKSYSDLQASNAQRFSDSSRAHERKSPLPWSAQHILFHRKT